MGDIRTEAGGEMPETRHEHVRRRNKIIFSTLAITIIIVTLGFVIKVPHKATAVGYITTAEYADVRASTAGRVAEILISSGDTVKKGDVMVKLESDTEKAAVEEAEKLVNKAEAELALRKATATENKRAHTEAIKLAELELKYAKEQLEVTKSLHAKGLASGRRLSEDTFAVTKGEEQLRVLKEKDMTLEDKQIAVLEQELETKKQVLSRAVAELNKRTIYAPIDGTVTRYSFYIGEMLRTDMVLYEIFQGEANCIKLRIPEKHAEKAVVGTPLRLTLGTYGGIIPHKFNGKVTYLRGVVEGSDNSFYRVAYCEFNPEGYNVSPGTSAKAKLNFGKQSLWRLIFMP